MSRNRAVEESCETRAPPCITAPLALRWLLPPSLCVYLLESSLNSRHFFITFWKHSWLWASHPTACLLEAGNDKWNCNNGLRWFILLLDTCTSSGEQVWDCDHPCPSYAYLSSKGSSSDKPSWTSWLNMKFSNFSGPRVNITKPQTFRSMENWAAWDLLSILIEMLPLLIQSGRYPHPRQG